MTQFNVGEDYLEEDQQYWIDSNGEEAVVDGDGGFFSSDEELFTAHILYKGKEIGYAVFPANEEYENAFFIPKSTEDYSDKCDEACLAAEVLYGDAKKASLQDLLDEFDFADSELKKALEQSFGKPKSKTSGEEKIARKVIGEYKKLPVAGESEETIVYYLEHESAKLFISTTICSRGMWDVSVHTATVEEVPESEEYGDEDDYDEYD